MQASTRQILDEFIIAPQAQRSWGTLVALDLFFEGVGAGLIAVSAALNQRPGMIAGLVLVLLGMAALFAHLGHPERFWRAALKPRTSWISRGVLLLSALVLFGVIAVLPPVASSGAGVVMRSIAGALAVLVMFYTGAVTAVASIPAWNSALLPIMSLAYSVAAGIAIALAVTAGAGTSTGPVSMAELEVTQLLLLAFCGACALVYVSMLASSTLAGRESSRMLTRGALAIPFLGGVVLLGLVVPLGLTWFAYAVGEMAATVALAVGAGLRLLGDFSLRSSLLKAGLYDPLL